MPKLEQLFVSGNQIDDITPLANVTTLTILALDDNRITDITALSALTNLTSLFLGGNRIADLSAVTGLTKLGELHLSYNYLDLRPGSAPMVAIAALQASGTLVDYDPQKVFCTITPTSGLHGSVAPGVPTPAGPGLAMRFAIVPDTGYHIADVRIDGTSVGTPSSYTFTNVLDQPHDLCDVCSQHLCDNGDGGIWRLHFAGGDQRGGVRRHAGLRHHTGVRQPHRASTRRRHRRIGPVTSYVFTRVMADHTISATFEANASPNSAVKSKASLGAPVAPKTMKKSKSYTVYGSLKPRHASGTTPVRIYKYKRIGGKWKSYGYVNAKAYDYASYTKYKVKLKLSSKGKWRLRAYAQEDAQHLKAWSSYDYITVK